MESFKNYAEEHQRDEKQKQENRLKLQKAIEKYKQEQLKK